MYSKNNENPYMIERIVTALTYPTMGSVNCLRCDFAAYRNYCKHAELCTFN